MKNLLFLFFFFWLDITTLSAQKATTGTAYFPPYGRWAEKKPAEMGLSGSALQSAIAFAIAHESPNPRKLSDDQAATFGREPFGDIIGPMPDRGDPTGLIIYKGYLIASWGDPSRCDMTHSVTKSFLSTVAGLAADKNLIGNVHDKVWSYLPPTELFLPGNEKGPPELLRPFETPHNKTISWDDLLRQTSDWEGTLWDKPEWADRPDSSRTDWKNRPRFKSGSVYEYNDVRVNALALALTQIWRKPLPQILRQHIMDPIGASDTWRWTGYRNAWIVLDGQPVQSVSGGGHWGGGMIINAYDMARFGLLTLHKGKWAGKPLISEKWIRQSLTPTAPKPDYGYMNWFLNTDQKLLPSAPASAFMHVGNGANIIYVDPDHELVVVSRWISYKNVDGLVKEILKAF